MGKGGGKGQQINDHGEPERMIKIRGLPFVTKWQELKDFLGSAGTVEFVKIFTEDGSNFGRSKGFACARYSTAAMATTAIQMFNEATLGDRYLEVDHWAGKDGPDEPGKMIWIRGLPF